MPVVALYAGHPDMIYEVEDAIRVSQDNEDAVAFGCAFARILEACILGESGEEAVATASKAGPKYWITSMVSSNCLAAMRPQVGISQLSRSEPHTSLKLSDSHRSSTRAVDPRTKASTTCWT